MKTKTRCLIRFRRSRQKYRIVHMSGRFKEPNECPDSENMLCGNPECNNAELDSGYGYAGGYGLGAYHFCPKCFAIYNFCEDNS